MSKAKTKKSGGAESVDADEEQTTQLSAAGADATGGEASAGESPAGQASADAGAASDPAVTPPAPIASTPPTSTVPEPKAEPKARYEIRTPVKLSRATRGGVSIVDGIGWTDQASCANHCRSLGYEVIDHGAKAAKDK